MSIFVSLTSMCARSEIKGRAYVSITAMQIIRMEGLATNNIIADLEYRDESLDAFVLEYTIIQFLPAGQCAELSGSRQCARLELRGWN